MERLGLHQQADLSLAHLRDPDGIFQEIAASVGLNHTGQGRGLLTFDADMDGDRDLLIFNNNQSALVF